jgi:hypothetical protein
MGSKSTVSTLLRTATAPNQAVVQAQQEGSSLNSSSIVGTRQYSGKRKARLMYM